MSEGTATRRVRTDDGVELHVEETGSGLPILFVHEFSGDAGSWEPQVRATADRSADARGP